MAFGQVLWSFDEADNVAHGCCNLCRRGLRVDDKGEVMEKTSLKPKRPFYSGTVRIENEKVSHNAQGKWGVFHK